MPVKASRNSASVTISPHIADSLLGVKISFRWRKMKPYRRRQKNGQRSPSPLIVPAALRAVSFEMLSAMATDMSCFVMVSNSDSIEDAQLERVSYSVQCTNDDSSASTDP